MKLGQPIDLRFSKRYYEFNRAFAVKDSFDALVELITNCDDSYHHIYEDKHRSKDGGSILVEICAKRGRPSILIVRDKAQGMTLENMQEKLGDVGTRRSEESDRGFMSRGAKDCTELGNITYESIVNDKYYKCELTTATQFIPLINGNKADDTIRSDLHIKRGNGTVVTVEVSRKTLPKIDKIKNYLPWHIALRDLLDEKSDSVVMIKDGNKKQEKSEKIVYRQAEKIIDEKISVQGYPGAIMHLVIWKSPEQLQDMSDKFFRKSGLIIKGKRAIHECSLLQPSFESDPYAKHYFGRIDCPYIDTLMNEYDIRREENENHPTENPSLVIDPNRRYGLDRKHPFTNALLEVPTKRLKELIDKDRAQETGSHKEIANQETKKRLDELARMATKFLTQESEDWDETTAQDEIDEDTFSKKGVLIIPTFANIGINEIRSFGLYAHKKICDREEVEVSIQSDSSALEIIDGTIILKSHKKRVDLLYGRFRVKGVAVEEAVCVETKCDYLPRTDALFNIVEDTIDERVFGSSFEFEHKNYKIKEGSKKTLKLYAEYPELVNNEIEIKVISSDNLNLPIRGKCLLVPIEESNYACADISIEARRLVHSNIVISAELGENEANTKVKIVQKEEDQGAKIDFDIRDEDFGNSRARWAEREGKPNLLLIAAKHPALKRYLGPPPDFIGQNSLSFKIMLVEIISEQICKKSLVHQCEKNSWLFRWADQKSDNIIAESVLAEIQKIMRRFLPMAHTIMIKDGELKEDT